MTEAEAEALIREMQELRTRMEAYVERAPRRRANLSAVLAALERVQGRPTIRLVRTEKADAS